LKNDYNDSISVTPATYGIRLHYQRNPKTMKNLLLTIALFVTMFFWFAGAAESAQPEKIYVQPVPVFYSWIGGYTNFPQFPTHRPSYYVWPTIVVKEEIKEETMMLGDLPQYF